MSYNEEVARVTNTGVFSEMHVKHRDNLQERIAACPEEVREAARQRLTAQATY